MFSLVTRAIERAVSCLWWEVGKRGWEKHSGEKCGRLAPHTGFFLKSKSFQKQWRRQNKLFSWKKGSFGDTQRKRGARRVLRGWRHWALPVRGSLAPRLWCRRPRVRTWSTCICLYKTHWSVVVFVIIPLYFCLMCFANTDWNSFNHLILEHDWRNHVLGTGPHLGNGPTWGPLPFCPSLGGQRSHQCLRPSLFTDPRLHW